MYVTIINPENCLLQMNFEKFVKKFKMKNGLLSIKFILYPYFTFPFVKYYGMFGMQPRLLSWSNRGRNNWDICKYQVLFNGPFLHVSPIIKTVIIFHMLFVIALCPPHYLKPPRFLPNLSYGHLQSKTMRYMQTWKSFSYVSSRRIFCFSVN